MYCPFLYKPAGLRKDERAIVRYHDPRDGALCLDVGSESLREHLQIAEREAMAEALRLLYVALTRAKHRVTVVLPTHKADASSALLYTLLGGNDLAAASARLSEIEARGGMRSFLEMLAAESQSLSVRDLPNEANSAPRVVTGREQLSAREVRRKLDGGFRTASFSSLVSGDSTRHEASADYDGLTADEANDDASYSSPLALAEFPRGAGPGKLIHEILEQLPFAADAATLSERVTAVLAARGYEANHEPALTRAVHAALRTPLDHAGLTLAAVVDSARINELEFLFPVRELLSARTLAKVLRSEKAPSADPSYARRVEALSFEALRGFMRGFIDLVFEHDERFYIVDYKSNDLGKAAQNYQGAHLTRAMNEHHYYLQYLVYCLALHRYLKRRRAGYDYARHFGGVYYLFLRGMHPEHEPGTGVFFDRPAQSLIEALDALMGDPARGSARAQDTELP